MMDGSPLVDELTPASRGSVNPEKPDLPMVNSKVTVGVRQSYG